MGKAGNGRGDEGKEKKERKGRERRGHPIFLPGLTPMH